MHVALPSRLIQTISAGGLLASPGGLALAADGTLFVADQSGYANGGPWYNYGQILRIDAGGGQSVFARDTTIFGPYDVAISSDGWVWSAQWGSLSRRQGGFVRTRISDGHTERVPSDRSQGLAANGAMVYLADCVSISLDCYAGYRYLVVYPDFVNRRYLPGGSLAVVPAIPTPVRRSTWGEIKVHYR